MQRAAVTDSRQFSGDKVELEKAITGAWLLIHGPEWPADEIRPFGSFRALIVSSHPSLDTRLLLHLTADRVVGMALLHVLKRTHTLFLEYLAVAPEFRRRGTGGELFLAARELGRRQGAVRVLLEYDSPERLSDEGRVRWRWYAKFGIRPLDIPYFQPPYRSRAGYKRMALGHCAFDNEAESIGAILDAVREIHTVVYGCNMASPPSRTVPELNHHAKPASYLPIPEL